MPKNVLIVEDDVFIAELLRRRLDEEGYETREARNSDKTLKKLEKQKPDIILMDIGLGEFSLDGWELNQVLKQNAEYKDIPVIAVTAHAQRAEHHDRAIREGFVDHVAKPIDFDVLLQKISSILQS